MMMMQSQRCFVCCVLIDIDDYDDDLLGYFAYSLALTSSTGPEENKTRVSRDYVERLFDNIQEADIYQFSLPLYCPISDHMTTP
jgi:hypothetical protein